MTNTGTPSSCGRVEDLLLVASQCVEAADPSVEPWLHGWSIEEHRRSDGAALPGTAGPVRLDACGVDALEDAVERLLSEPEISVRWDRDDFWGIVACAAVKSSTTVDPAERIAATVRAWRTAPPTLVVLPVANVLWRTAPLDIAGGVIGNLGTEFAATVARRAASPEQGCDLGSDEAQAWFECHTAGARQARDPVAAAVWPTSQQQRAFDDAMEWFEDICGLALLLEPAPHKHGLWSLRGAHNRPGVRGLTPDREALESLLDESGALDLECRPLVMSQQFGTYDSAHWYSTDPVPLDELLAAPATVELVGRLATAAAAVAARIRVAARWHADAHWADRPQDAVLSLGIALDAIIGSPGGLADSLRAHRFASLADPQARREALARCAELNTARARIIDGCHVPARTDTMFVRSFADAVRWAARQLVTVDPEFKMRSDSDLDETLGMLALAS